MLKRIIELRNIGRFRSAAPSGIEFGQLTVVYGPNTYGKSTLCDILSSMAYQSPIMIQSRESIPADGAGQVARLNFLLPGETSEQQFSFQNGRWGMGQRTPPRLAVFDDGFYHKNVFSGSNFTRATKENFSAFILGAPGVALAQATAQRKSQRNVATRERNQLQNNVFANVANLTTFISLQPDKTAEELQAKIASRQRQLGDLETRQRNQAEIQARPDLIHLAWSANITEALESLNTALGTSFEQVHVDAERRMTAHIAATFHTAEGAQQWIQTGLLQNLGEWCQFCGQSLSADAIALLDTYRECFDDAFDAFQRDVLHRLQQSRVLLEANSISPLRLALERTEATLGKYPELATDTDFSFLRNQCTQIFNRLRDNVSDLERAIGEIRQKALVAIESKRATLNRPFEPVSAETVSILLAVIGDDIRQLDLVRERLAEQISRFKRESNDESIATEAAEVRNRLGSLNPKLQRINLDAQCSRYIELSAELRKLSDEIAELEQRLSEEQSEYLEHLFNEINRWFSTFGSTEFELERGEDRSGNTPIFYLRVKFRGQAVGENELDKVFSESDRRALSLSIFWANLSVRPDSELIETVVVLDDPLTSFDTGRITAVHQEIMRLSRRVGQVIVLSHYEPEIRELLQKYRSGHSISLLEIQHQTNGSTLGRMDVDSFLMDTHGRVRSSILAFIEGQTNEHHFGDLRVFFEQEIRFRFARQLSADGLKSVQLRALIDFLRKQGVLDAVTADEAHLWRETLNPSHHVWTTTDLEDRRSTTRRFMDFVYEAFR